jgi:hypothetical protein
MAELVKKRVLITVRTYPVPATKGVEVSCTAGVTDDGKWIRLFPLPYRLLDDENKFKKYQWVKVKLSKARHDSRPESFNPQINEIETGNILSAERGWAARWNVLRPLVSPSLCELRADCELDGRPTLGRIKPEIERLIIEPCAAEWSQKQLETLRQGSLFQKAPAQELEKLPFAFSYQFRCKKLFCPGHTMMCTDWEMGEAYRHWRRKYGDGWEAKFREKFETEMIEKNDTHFYVGNLHQFPNAWIVIGLFYPPRETTRDMFLN